LVATTSNRAYKGKRKMSYTTEIIKLIESKDIEQLNTGLDELLIREDGRKIVEYLLTHHSKRNIYVPSPWPTFKKSVLQYIEINKIESSKEIKQIARELGITPKTLRAAINEEKT
jgi:AraC-like DNA-binding protein